MILKLVDVLVHVDETLDPAGQAGLDDGVRLKCQARALPPHVGEGAN